MKVAETVTLLTSEVVTNAVFHAGTDISVAVSVGERSVRVDVTDASPALPAPRHYHADAQTGRGLSLVAAASKQWGTRTTGGGKVVWFEVPL